MNRSATLQTRKTGTLRKGKSILSVILIFCLLFSYVPTLAFAEGETVDMNALFPTEELRDQIYVSMNLQDGDDVSLSNLQGITFLSLYGKTPTAADFEGLKLLSGLTEFDLSHSECNTLPGDFFSGMSALSTISICENPQMTSLPDGLLSGLSSLTNVNIADNQLEELPVDFFQNVPTACAVNISNNHIDLSTASFSFPEGYSGDFQYTPQFIYQFEGVPSAATLPANSGQTWTISAWNWQMGTYNPQTGTFEMISPWIFSEITPNLTVESNSDCLNVSLAGNHLTLEALTPGSAVVTFKYQGELARNMAITVGEAITGVINFPDQKLKAALIASGVDTSGDGYITESEMAGVYGPLPLANQGITDLTGLQYAIHATAIDLGYNEVVNLDPLATLTSLTNLTLISNRITDISPLLGLSGLRYLDIGENSLTNFTAVSALTSLETLYFRHQVQYTLNDIEPLSQMTNLKGLWITGTTLSDISPIAALVNLDNVDLQGNNISSIAALAPLVKLNLISLDNNPLEDISPLAGLNELQVLWLRYTKNVKDISALGTLPKLYSVYLDDNKIEDVTPLSNSQTLRYLSLPRNKVADIAPLANCSKLLQLEISDNPVVNLAPLADFPMLTRLTADRILAQDFTPISEMATLKELRLSFNRIENIDFVSGMTGLVDLGLGYNALRDLEPVKNLTNLETLWVNDNALEVLPPDTFEKLTKLRTLQLTNNAVPLDTQSLTLPAGIATSGFYYNDQFPVAFEAVNDPILVKTGESTDRSLVATAQKVSAAGFDATSGRFTGVTQADLGSITDKFSVSLTRGNAVASAVKTGDAARVTGITQGTTSLFVDWTDAAKGIYNPKTVRVTSVEVDDTPLILPKFSFAVSSASVKEGESYAVTVERNLPFGNTTCQVALGIGTAGPEDYTSSAVLPVTLHFADGETKKTITFTPLADGKKEGLETIELGIMKAGLETIDFPPRFVLTIVDTVEREEAQVVSVNCPATMITDQENTATITLRNSGTTTWNTRAPLIDFHNPGMPGNIYDLKVGVAGTSNGDGPDDFEPFLSLTKTRSKDVVAPGEEVTYTLKITPHTTWDYAIQCRMLGEDINGDGSPTLQYFGDTATLTFTSREPVFGAEILAFNSPTTMMTGQPYEVTATVKNTGETTWTPTSADTGTPWDWPGNILVWYLGNETQSPNRPGVDSEAQFDWSLKTSDPSVAPGETVTYTYTFTPRANAVGMKDMHFRMLGLNAQNSYSYFGETKNATVQVEKPADRAQVVSVNCPATMITDQENTATITLRNSGTTTWNTRAPLIDFHNPGMPGNIYDLKVGVAGTSNGDGPDDFEPFLSLTKTRSKDVVAPGEEVTYTLKITPHTTWDYAIQCRMLGEDINGDGSPTLQYFGDTATLTFASREPVFGAEILAFNSPTTMMTGQPYEVTATVKNTGETTWTPASADTGTPWDWPGNTLVWYLGNETQSPNRPGVDSEAQFDWSLKTSDPSVAPGETVTYTYTFTPRANAVGMKDMHFRMLGLNAQNSYSYFGETKNVTVQVKKPGIAIPTTAVVGGIEITILNGTIQAPPGVDLSGLLTNNRLVIPVWSGDEIEQMGTLEIEALSVSGNTAQVGPAVLRGSLHRLLNGRSYEIQLEVNLNHIPEAGSLEIAMDPVESADMSAIEALLRQGGQGAAGSPLFIVNVVKHNVLQSDIGITRMEVVMDKPSAYDGQTGFKMLKEDGSNRILLQTTAVVEGNLMRFTGISPGGFSRFILVPLAALGQNAEITGDNIPAAMKVGETGIYWVAVKNTGTVNWDARNGFKLSGLGDASLFKTLSIPILKGLVVKPGQKTTFAVVLSAPAQEGTYSVNYQMQSSKGLFGVVLKKTIVVDKPLYDSAFSKVSIPDQMKAGHSYTARITVVNKGNVSWLLDSEAIRLNGLEDTKSFGLTKPVTAHFIAIQPGESYTFTITLKAPRKTGAYDIGLQLSRGHSLLGPVYHQTVRVKK